ncbi:MAG TPA: PQQ-binding-like beta-propeller repeat protein [Gemmataceae bacterium]|jgi:outer membrane protein assembly factor BamB|nr:PQQ-binding-like beta-propeller repeat protein [Gemmataceae bacterium]
MSCQRLATTLLMSAVLLGTPSAAKAQLKAAPGDWPGWRGPDRTDVSTETGLLQEWPAGGPKLVWKATGLGGGFTTPSIAGGRIYLMGSKGREEYVMALDAKDGKHLWSTKVGAVGLNRGPQNPGPRSTPIVDGDFVYTLGSDGDLVCVTRAKGKTVWHKHLVQDFGGKPGNWAYAESPLIDGDVLVCTPGGSSATLVALDKKTAELIWKAQVPGRNAAGYASAIVAQVGGVKQYIQFLAGGVVGISAKDGKFLWSYNKTAGRGTVCSTPIFHDQCVFTASGYNVGGGLVKLTADGNDVAAEEVYFTKAMVNHHGGIVLVDGYLYGTNNATLLCLDFKTGKTKWQDRSVGKGSLTYADGRLYVRGERGGVALVEATPDGYKEKGRFNPPNRSSKPAWPHPVVAGGRMYLRDGDVLLCYDVKAN